MANRLAKPEKIVTKLRQVGILVGQGMPHTNRVALGALQWASSQPGGSLHVADFGLDGTSASPLGADR